MPLRTVKGTLEGEGAKDAAGGRNQANNLGGAIKPSLNKMNELALLQDFTHEQKFHMGSVSLCVLDVAQIQMTTRSAVLVLDV